MKKTFALIITLMLCISCLASCSEPYLTKYDNDEIGLHYEIANNFKYTKYSAWGKYATYQAEDAKVEISFFSSSVLDQNPSLGADVTLEEYIRYNIEDVNDLGELNIEIDYNDAKTRATYDIIIAQSENDIGVYTYYTLIKNNNGIYMVEMSCQDTDEAIAKYAQQFVIWSGLIYAY